jgi:hypothetical protein
MDNWTLLAKNDTPRDLLNTHEMGQPEALLQQGAIKPKLALGVHFSPSGQIIENFHFLCKKCRRWASKISKYSLNLPEAFTP